SFVHQMPRRMFFAHPHTIVLVLRYGYFLSQPVVTLVINLIDMKYEARENWRLRAAGKVHPRCIRNQREPAEQEQQVLQHTLYHYLVLFISQPQCRKVAIPIILFAEFKRSTWLICWDNIGVRQPYQSPVIFIVMVF